LLFAALLSASVLLAGCSRKVERQYKAADWLLAENKPDLAAAEFERLVQAHPDHPLAAVAHYKLAYLYRTHGTDPSKAIEQYRIIADRYSGSEYADDALLWLASMGRAQQDVGMIREAVKRLETNHADRPSACARARVQLALALLDAGSPETKVVCEDILKQYPDQTGQCAQAQLILARALEKIDKNHEAAIAQLEKVRAAYPDTTSAVEAEERIGLLYYGVSVSARNKAAAAAKKHIGGVPAFTHGPEAGIQVLTLEALRALLKQRQVDTDLNTLRAISGAAFQFVYQAGNRDMGAVVFATNPFETAAASFGFVPLKSSSGSPEEAMLSLCQTLDRGKPVVVPYSDLGWVIVVGYDQSAREFLYLRPGAKGERSQKFDDFAARWKLAADEAGGELDSFYQFTLGPGKGRPSSAGLVREAARRGSSLFQRSTVFGAPAGRAAYEALVADLEAHASGTLPEDAKALAAWAEEPLSVLREGRTAAAEFLEHSAAGLPEPMGSQARTASEAYRSLAAKLGELDTTFPRPPEDAPAGSLQPEYAASATAAAQVAREAMELDRKAAEDLSALASE